MFRRPLTPRRVRLLITALAVSTVLPMACRIDPAPSLDPAGHSWRTFVSPLGFSIDYPDAYRVTDLGGGQPAFEYQGTIAARVVWVTEEEGRRRGLWFGAPLEREIDLGGRPGRLYQYDHGDGPFYSRTHAAVMPHRGRFLGIELRTDGVDEVGRRMIASLRVEE